MELILFVLAELVKEVKLVFVELVLLELANEVKLVDLLIGLKYARDHFYVGLSHVAHVADLLQHCNIDNIDWTAATAHCGFTSLRHVRQRALRLHSA